MSTSAIDIRRADEQDIPNLVESIISAEKSGTSKLSYSTLFTISEPELRALLAEILAEDVIGQELCVSGFLIAAQQGRFAGAMCAWVEGAGLKSSSLLKGNVLAYFFGRDRIAAATKNLKLMDELSLPRTPGALQIESVHVDAGHRGMGVCAQLLGAHEVQARRTISNLSKVQVILSKTNSAALSAYTKWGFRITEERSTQNLQVLDLLPSTSKILMERHLP